MKTTTSAMALAAACLLLSAASYSQDTRAFNQNSSRSNHTRGMSIFFSPVYTTPVGKGEDSLLFRGSGAGIKFGGDYFFGNIGLGVVSGFSSSVADDALINSFLKNNSIPQDQLVISKSAQQSMYLLLGPAVRFGNAVQLFAHAKGGLFINNGGLVNIQQKGAVRSIYRNEATSKSIYPGFQAGFGVQYSTKSDTWSFGFGADYMNTKTQMQNYDLRRGNGIEGLKLSRNISDLLAGISIRYTIKSPRDAASGQATGRRTRDAASGQAAGRRSTITTRDAASGLATGRRTPGVVTEEVIITDVVELPEPGNAPGCGPVTQRMTNPDGSTSEMTFACPDDAAAYTQRINGGGMPNRISMNVTTPKQTQGATFGEKVNQGLHAAGSSLSQGTNIISGNISWATEGSTGIVTNNSVSALAGGGSGAAAASYAATGRMASQGSGSVMTLYTREAGSGQASGRREKGSGLATGRRQYEPFYKEGVTGDCTGCAVNAKLSTVKNNPLYQGNSTAGNNPMHERSMQSGGQEPGLGGVEVYLKDPRNGAVIASTVTNASGNYFFANVPDGDYVVALVAAYASKKGYDYYQAQSSDLRGVVQTAGTGILSRIEQFPTDKPVDPATAASLIKTKTKSNQSNDRQAAPAAEEGIWSPRSNFTRTIVVAAGDLDGDGSPDLIAGANAEREVLKQYFEKGDKPTQERMVNPGGVGESALLGGALPGGGIVSALARPGSPIGGLSIKGGKNPGGNIQSRTTNENGEFEFTDLEPGNYTFTAEQTLYINDASLISVGNSKVQDHNSSRSNKSSSSIAPDPGNGGGGSGGNKVQDHNSSRSNKSSSLMDNDADNGDNSVQRGITKITASQNSQSLRNGAVKVTATQNSQSLRTISVIADMDGDGIYETDVTSKVSDELIIDKDGNVSTPQQKAGISTSRSNIRNKSGLQAVTSTVFTVQGSATVNGKDVPVQAVYKVVEKATSGLKDTLKTQV